MPDLSCFHSVDSLSSAWANLVSRVNTVPINKTQTTSPTTVIGFIGSPEENVIAQPVFASLYVSLKHVKGKFVSQQGKQLSN